MAKSEKRREKERLRKREKRHKRERQQEDSREDSIESPAVSDTDQIDTRVVEEAPDVVGQDPVIDEPTASESRDENNEEPGGDSGEPDNRKGIVSSGYVTDKDEIIDSSREEDLERESAVVAKTSSYETKEPPKKYPCCNASVLVSKIPGTYRGERVIRVFLHPCNCGDPRGFGFLDPPVE